MSHVAASQESAPQGTFELRWITPGAIKDIRRLDRKYRVAVLKKISDHISLHRRLSLKGEHLDDVFKFPMGNSVRLSFILTEGEYTVVHVGFHEEFEHFADKRGCLPSLRRRISLRKFIRLQEAEEKQRRKRKAILERQKHRLAATVLNAAAKTLPPQNGDCLVARYRDEATSRLERLARDTQASVAADVRAMLAEATAELDSKLAAVKGRVRAMSKRSSRLQSGVDLLLAAVPPNAEGNTAEAVPCRDAA